MPNIDDFEKAKEELHKEERITAVYDTCNSVKAAVLSVIPCLGALIDKLSDQKFANYQNEKRQKFVDVVLSNTDLITSDKVINEACIINIAKTIELVDRCASADKVVYYGNLVRNGYFEYSEQIGNDLFDEYEAILKDLSFREIQYLIFFAKAARENDGHLNGNALQTYFNHMKSIYPDVDPNIMLNRLQRTGFITDEMSWVDIEEADSNNSLQLGSGISFVLHSAYDEFERIVLSGFEQKEAK